MSVVETQATEEQRGQKSKYMMFKRVENGLWQELGELEADGAYDARMKAVKQFNLMQEVRDGTLELVSLGARFWLPKKPKVNVSESLDVS